MDRELRGGGKMPPELTQIAQRRWNDSLDDDDSIGCEGKGENTSVGESAYDSEQAKERD